MGFYKNIMTKEDVLGERGYCKFCDSDMVKYKKIIGKNVIHYQIRCFNCEKSYLVKKHFIPKSADIEIKKSKAILKQERNKKAIPLPL